MIDVVLKGVMLVGELLLECFNLVDELLLANFRRVGRGVGAAME